MPLPPLLTVVKPMVVFEIQEEMTEAMALKLVSLSPPPPPSPPLPPSVPFSLSLSLSVCLSVSLYRARARALSLAGSLAALLSSYTSVSPHAIARVLVNTSVLVTLCMLLHVHDALHAPACPCAWTCRSMQMDMQEHAHVYAAAYTCI
jgi:hypothetical protein